MGWSWRGSNGAVGGAGTAANFCQPGWVAPRAASFPLFGCCPVSRPAGRLGLEMACLRPAIVAVAGKSTFCELRANCSDWLFATCIAREVPEVPAGGSQNCGGSPSSISSGCCCCCSRMNLSTRCMTGKKIRLILSWPRTSQRPSSVAHPTFVRGDARLLPGCQSLAPWTARCWCCPSWAAPAPSLERSEWNLRSM